MDTTLSLTAATALDEARAEIERMARAAITPDAARGWWHAARIVRLFGNAGRAMKQCAQHARFHAASAPEKSAAFRGAMGILARHTGESLAAFMAAADERAAAAGASRKTSSMAGEGRRAVKTAASNKRRAATAGGSADSALRKKGPGWMGWAGSEIPGANMTTTRSLADSSSCPSYPSRSLVHRLGAHSSRI